MIDNSKLEAEILSKLGTFPQGIVESALFTRLHEARNYQHSHSVLLSLEKRDVIMFCADSKWRLTGRPAELVEIVAGAAVVLEPEPEPEAVAEVQADSEPEVEPEPESQAEQVKGKTRDLVLQALYSDRSRTLAEVAAACKLEEPAAYYHIKRMVDLGIVVRNQGFDNRVSYRLATEEPANTPAADGRPATLADVVAKHVHKEPDEPEEADRVIAEKPPLGLMPRHLFEERIIFRRIDEITGAMLRSTHAGRTVPPEWLLELVARTEQLKETRRGQVTL